MRTRPLQHLVAEQRLAPYAYEGELVPRGNRRSGTRGLDRRVTAAADGRRWARLNEPQTTSCTSVGRSKTERPFESNETRNRSSQEARSGRVPKMVLLEPSHDLVKRLLIGLQVAIQEARVSP